MQKKILLIDDNPHILEAMELILVFENYDVKVLTKAENIVQIVKTMKPNLILLDYLLSGETGKEVAELLKHDLHTKNIPIVIISAHPGAEKYALEAGADAFLAKPFEVADFLTLVKKYAAKSV